MVLLSLRNFLAGRAALTLVIWFGAGWIISSAIASARSWWVLADREQNQYKQNNSSQESC